MHRHRLARPATPLWQERGAISPAFFARMADARMLRPDRSLALGRRYRPELERTAMLRLNAAASGPFMHAMASSFGIEIRDPTSDVRLVEYCFGLPEQQYVHQGGRRTLIRRAMNDQLPASVRDAERRGLQASDLVPRLMTVASDVDAALARLGSSAAVRKYLDVDALHRVWREVPTGTRDSALQARTKLLRGLLAGAFITRSAGC